MKCRHNLRLGAQILLHWSEDPTNDEVCTKERSLTYKTYLTIDQNLVLLQKFHLVHCDGRIESYSSRRVACTSKVCEEFQR